MSIELITTWPQLAALETRWNDLAAGMPFRSWDWLATWWKHYGTAARGHVGNQPPNDRQLYLLAVYGEENYSNGNGERELIGIAPWYLDRSIVTGKVLRWLGSGEVCSDHLSLVCHPENQEHVAAAVADALTHTCDDWDRLDLDAVDADDGAVSALATQLEMRECLVSRQAADACWVLDLPSSWDDYLASVSKSHRKQLRQLDRQVLETERVEWHSATGSADFDVAWNVLVDLHQRRRQSLGEPGCFASRTFHAFHREVSGCLLERGQLRLSWLTLDGQPAAAEYQFADGRTTYAYQSGLDPDRLADQPGRLSTILCVRAALNEGHARFDFLRGNEPYKAHWRAEPRATWNYRIVPNRRLARLRGRVLSLTGFAKSGFKICSRVF